jgi:hypothetical protein
MMIVLEIIGALAFFAFVIAIEEGVAWAYHRARRR